MYEIRSFWSFSVAVNAWSEAWILCADIVTVGSNPSQGFDFCPQLFFWLSCEQVET